MGYDSSKLNLASQPIAGRRNWNYDDTGGETGAVYQGAGFFTDAYTKGVRQYDSIEVIDQTNGQVYHGYFSVSQDTGNTQGTVVFDTD